MVTLSGANVVPSQVAGTTSLTVWYLAFFCDNIHVKFQLRKEMLSTEAASYMI